MARAVTDRRVAPIGATSGLAGAMLAAVAERLPSVARALAHDPSLTVGEYVSRLHVEHGVSLQPHDDVAQAVHALAEPLLGSDTADAAARTLSESPSVLTANHHGVDCFAQSVQGTLAASLAGRDSARRAPEAVVVLACAAVPLNNLTFPRGLIAYLESDVDPASRPLRLPLFPDRCKRSLVSSVAAFDAQMLERFAQRVRKQTAAQRLSARLTPTIVRVLDEDFGCGEVLSLDTYSRQSTVLNHRLWQRMSAECGALPPLVYLPLEAVASRILERDLCDTTSLAHAVLFHDELRERVLSALDAERGCWNRGALARRVLASGEESPTSAATGTIFFWGVDRRQRRVPLAVTAGSGGKPALLGLSDGGERIEITFDPISVGQALKDGRLLPSLFLSYLCLALARGVNCLGGYYQAEYLPVMQRAVAQALTEASNSREAAQAVSNVTTNSYLSGMQLVCTRNRVDGLIPAGPLELIAAGGLSANDLDRMAGTSVQDAHLASIVDTACDAAPDLVRQENWRVEVAKELGTLLKDGVVVKAVSSTT